MDKLVEWFDFSSFALDDDDGRSPGPVLVSLSSTNPNTELAPESNITHCTLTSDNKEINLIFHWPR
jgi:hypothetical protein